jgi:hypothetical protein
MIPPCSLLPASGREKTSFESAVQSPLTSWSMTFLAVLVLPCKSPFWEVMVRFPPPIRRRASSGRSTCHWAPSAGPSNSSVPATVWSRFTV